MTVCSIEMIKTALMLSRHYNEKQMEQICNDIQSYFDELPVFEGHILSTTVVTQEKGVKPKRIRTIINREASKALGLMIRDYWEIDRGNLPYGTNNTVKLYVLKHIKTQEEIDNAKSNTERLTPRKPIEPKVDNRVYAMKKLCKYKLNGKCKRPDYLKHNCIRCPDRVEVECRKNDSRRKAIKGF